MTNLEYIEVMRAIRKENAPTIKGGHPGAPEAAVARPRRRTGGPTGPRRYPTPRPGAG